MANEKLSVKACAKFAVDSKESDKWYTPLFIVNLIIEVLKAIDLDPCADKGKHISAQQHYTAADDGLLKPWHGRVFMNPPYSCPGKWMAKLQAEIESGRVKEAIALVPAATDTNWLRGVLATQTVCFWKGRIKFLDVEYKPKLSARQCHVLIYWGNNPQRFKEVFRLHGVVMMADCQNLNGLEYETEGNQLTIFSSVHKFLDTGISEKEEHETMTFQFSQTQAIINQIAQLQEQLNQLNVSLKPYQECEQKAEDLRLQAAEYSRKMTEAGIPQNDIAKWAKSLYYAASKTEPTQDYSIVADLELQITQMKNEIMIAQNERDQLEKQLKELVPVAQNNQELEVLKQEMVELKTINDLLKAENNLLRKRVEEQAKQEAIQEEEAYTKILSIGDIVRVSEELLQGEVTIEESDLIGEVIRFVDKIIVVKLADGEFNYQRAQIKWIKTPIQSQQFHNFQEGDRVSVIDAVDEELKYLFHKRGTVVGVKGSSVAVLFDATDKEAQHETVVSVSCLKLVEDKHPDFISQAKGSDFINKIRSQAGMNNITWQNISEVCLGNPTVLREMRLSATKKCQKELIEKLPQLMADYISETGDITDLGWVDNTLKLKVEEILKANDLTVRES